MPSHHPQTRNASQPVSTLATAPADATRARAVGRSRRGTNAPVVARRRPTSAPSPPARRERVPYLDNLKALLVAAIIVAHSLVAYSDYSGAWPYQTVQEVRLSGVTNAVLRVPMVAGVLFAMGLFFLISGLVTPGSIERKGPPRYARDRIVRLGIPLVVFLFMWQGLIWFTYRQTGYSTWSYWAVFMHASPFLEPGPMWFVGVLLIYSLGYAAWRQWRRHHASPFAAHARSASDGRDQLSGRTLIALAAGISIATILVRPVFPFLSGQIGQLKLWQWPQYLAMFGLGIVAAQRRWLDPLPDRIWRRCGAAALSATVAVLLLLLAIHLAGDSTNVLKERLHWAATLLAAIEGPLAVSACVWLIGAAQRHLNRPPHALGRALARSAFGAFIIQGPVLIALMLELRPLAASAEIKALIVACAGVTISFALSWLLVTRTPIGRIL
jgi:Acyltransferase family